jgi:hypothetical protein
MSRKRNARVSARRRRWATAAAGAAVLWVSGCGSLSTEDVEGVAGAFAGAENDPAARCDLLAANTLEALVEHEGARCEDAIATMSIGSGDITSVEVWGEEAQAQLTDDTLFLTRTPEGWRVTAAACRAQGADRPYDCRLEGA